MLAEPRHTAEHGRTEDDAADHFGNDAWLPEKLEDPCETGCKDDDDDELDDEEGDGLRVESEVKLARWGCYHVLVT